MRGTWSDSDLVYSYLAIIWEVDFQDRGIVELCMDHAMIERASISYLILLQEIHKYPISDLISLLGTLLVILVFAMVPSPSDAMSGNILTSAVRF